MDTCLPISNTATIHSGIAVLYVFFIECFKSWSTFCQGLFLSMLRVLTVFVLHPRIHGIAVSDNALYFHKHASVIYKEIGLDVESRDILDIVEGHTGQGYGIARDEDYSKYAMHMYKIVFIDGN